MMYIYQFIDLVGFFVKSYFFTSIIFPFYGLSILVFIVHLIIYFIRGAKADV